MTELLQPQHLQILDQYLAASDGIILVRYSASLVILAANAAFLTQTQAAAPAIGEGLHRFICTPDGHECSLLACNTAELPIAFFAKLRPTDCTYHCRLYADAGTYLLLGQRIANAESDGLQRASLMTNELIHLTLELRRRNSELEQANETIRELTRLDPLTNLPNRRRFAEALDSAMAVARRHQHALSLIMIDIDSFKSVNDSYGHDAGDGVLIMFAGLLKECCRGEDLPVRLGGEEFLLLAPNTAVDEAYILSERLRQRLAAAEIPNGVHVTASFGVTQMLPQDTYFAFMKRADMALYDAKSGGRNKTVVRMSNDPTI